jgi:hypothetical protein
MNHIVTREALLSFPIDPVGDFTFDGRTIAENTAFFHQVFTMEDDILYAAGWAALAWEINKQDSFN